MCDRLARLASRPRVPAHSCAPCPCCALLHCAALCSDWEVMVNVSAIGWGMLLVLAIWPPVGTRERCFFPCPALLRRGCLGVPAGCQLRSADRAPLRRVCAAVVPRVETEQGWRVKWDVFQQAPTRSRTLSGQLSEQSGSPPPSGLGAALMSLGAQLSSRLLPHFGQPPRASSRVMPDAFQPPPPRAASLPAALAPAAADSAAAAADTAPLYELHHHGHEAPPGIPETITEGAGAEGSAERSSAERWSSCPIMCVPRLLSPAPLTCLQASPRRTSPSTPPRCMPRPPTSALFSPAPCSARSPHPRRHAWILPRAAAAITYCRAAGSGLPLHVPSHAAMRHAGGPGSRGGTASSAPAGGPSLAPAAPQP